MESEPTLFRFDETSTWGWRYWIGVLLSIGIAAVNLYVGYTASEPPILAVGISFLFGVVLFFTRLWRPVLYLLGVLHVAVLGVIWVLSGLQFLAIGLVNGVLSLSLGAIALWLFIEEERSAVSSDT